MIWTLSYGLPLALGLALLAYWRPYAALVPACAVASHLWAAAGVIPALPIAPLTLLWTVMFFAWNRGEWGVNAVLSLTAVALYGWDVYLFMTRHDIFEPTSAAPLDPSVMYTLTNAMLLGLVAMIGRAILFSVREEKKDPAAA